MKKTLFIGGIKSGKSLNAQNYILASSLQKPIYLATTEFIDKELQERINAHKQSRMDSFETIEEPLKLYNKILECKSAILVECVSMWINNMLYHGFTFADMKEELEKILELDKTVVFVLNDIGSGVIPDNALAREFVDISGKLSQLIASKCDEVYHTIAGISTRIK
ncbi:adenosylcobinamide kinase [Sulfurimonas denitrificans DSM 1251]|uniref:Adenosylcobinamide kinase n=1 Tax=Sulfurimonas denitrificans (strain ATCC 33889 / DSM 1251) TaxID=326298 RepID=Q30UD8_SULDN|nr:bifunctional adenosylcobinamide kinase/adenosylcobinamide-phosphate guanylyltransferase [Sulfurimonas denitrificans]ABB43393.1 adenosylcobinamide kinase [Sulfurimonas denitrificans DSM 1251]MDD3442257.1 bifunctional adenosylcobinamide kinase/adenosylcobinamide-phosphate guanylyltransferase [Sulfurimonas denitrificans]